MKKNLPKLEDLAQKIQDAQAIVIGAGAGLSTAAGLEYSGTRFMNYFADFHEEYGINDIYSGGFYPFSTEEEQWGWWCRHIFYNRFQPESLPLYQLLFSLVEEKNYFVLTTNVDHQFQKAGFSKERLFYTQGDYGLFHCATPCHQENYDNESHIHQMIQAQTGRFIPSDLIPRCPKCGGDMTPTLRKDEKFVEDQGWHAAQQRYSLFLEENKSKKVLFFELGVGFNTPGIIKYPFMQMCYHWDNATFASINQEQGDVPKEIKKKSMIFQGDLRKNMEELAEIMKKTSHQ